jgi:hypothetical protein
MTTPAPLVIIGASYAGTQLAATARATAQQLAATQATI